jgi:predicted transcriptional regulator
MTNELRTLEEKIAEKVGSELVDLIGEEKWQEIIKATVDNFMTNKAPKLVEDMLVKQLQENVIAATKFGVEPKYDGLVGQLASDFMVEVMKKAGPEVLANMFQYQIQTAIQNLNTRY